MQKVSEAYKQAMKKPFRNKGHIKAMIGVVNMGAQGAVEFNDTRNRFIYFASVAGVINSEPVTKPYATYEENYTRVDGSMYFLPRGTAKYYNQGIITDDLLGKVYVSFGGRIGFDIKGLTIDFGICYPTRLRIESNNGVHEYTNDAQVFVTEDTFDNTSFFIITALEMVGGQDRLRIVRFTCGIANVFSNSEVEDFFFKDYSSTLSDSIPSHDMTLTVNNRDLYYSPDNPESALAYLEQGQEVNVSFGYEIDDDGTIEWVEPTQTYLKTWSADDTNAKFNAVDVFDFKMNGTYYKGLYRQNGISLYDLAVDVFEDGGIDDPAEYYIDPYLKKVMVQNPLPVTTHAQCIQIIANAGRCSLTLERGKRVCIKSQFIPENSVSVNNKTAWSHIERLLDAVAKDAYAEYSFDYIMIDETMLFLPRNQADWKDTTGYVSQSIYRDGYWEGEEPKITITFESAWVFFGLIVNFRSLAPEQFTVAFYKDNAQVGQWVIDNPELEYISFDQSPETDKLIITITKGTPNARAFIDSILINDITDYRLTRGFDLAASPIAIRQNRIKSISVARHIYNYFTTRNEVSKGEIYVQGGNTNETVSFTNAVYSHAATIITEPSGMASVRVASSTPYTVTLTISASTPAKRTLYTGNVTTSEVREVSAYLNKPAYDLTPTITSGSATISIIETTNNTVRMRITPTASGSQTISYALSGREKILAKYFVTGVETKALTQGEVNLPVGKTVVRAQVPKPSYQFTVRVTEGTASAVIVNSSSHFADIEFTLSSAQTIKYAVHGYEYVVDDQKYVKEHRVFGEAIEWDNPIVSSLSHAQDMEEWLESYYLGDVDYNFDWRGDPRVDANDLFYLELKERDDALIRAYQSELNFNGSWIGNIRARKAVVSWR